MVGGRVDVKITIIPVNNDNQIITIIIIIMIIIIILIFLYVESTDLRPLPSNFLGRYSKSVVPMG